MNCLGSRDIRLTWEDYLIVGDSLIKNVKSWRKTNGDKGIQCDITPFRGCTIDRLTDKIRRGRIEIGKYKKIIIAIGTNNITQSKTQMKFHLTELVDEIKQKNPEAKVIYSSILPRPKDHSDTWEKILAINSWMNANKRQGKFHTWQTYKPFIYKRKKDEKAEPKSHLYSDGLHLTPDGEKILDQQLRMALSVL